MGIHRWKMMLRRKLQDLTVCCTYKVDFLHQKAHSVKEFKKQYSVLEEIGRGGFGIVYKALRNSDNLPVAVKFIEHKHVREWTMNCNQLVPSELCHLETCKDIPGVIKLIDWFASSKGFLIVMERPSTCMDIFDLVSTYGRLDEDTARGVFVQVVDSVCAMYGKHGLIHRDIKDENIIIDMETGEVKLVDFGATALAEKAMKKEFQGTRSYCPPEWFRQLQYLPLEATSWSLGVLLFILVTGHLPFKNEIQICLGRVKFPTYLSKECCQLIKSCLTTAVGSRASLLQIREHSWLNRPIAVYSKTFQQVLDETLGRFNANSGDVTLRMDCPQALNEYREVNDVILTEEQRTTVTQKEKELSPDSDNQSMITAREQTGSVVSMRRLNSRYDNISSSSFADYMSMTSLATNSTAQLPDTVSMSTGLYFSTTSINEETEEDEEEADSSLSDISVPPVYSISGYNLAARARRRSMMFKSFDRELDTVLEQTPNDHLPLIMTVSSSSSQNSADEPTICEDSVSPSTTEQDEDLPCLSRHRPLKMAPGSSLPFYEAQAMSCS